MARARLQQERSRATRLAIIDAAEELWREKDFDSVSVEDVCRRAGVAKGTFYFYFPRKEHLLVMLVFGRMLPRQAQLKTLLEGDLDTAEVCADLVSGIGARARRLAPQLVLRAVEESFSHYREIGKLEGGDRSMRWYLEPAFQRGLARGDVNAAWDGKILAGMLGWGTLQELALWGQGQTTDRQLEPNLRQRADLITAGAATARREPAAKPKPRVRKVAG